MERRATSPSLPYSTPSAALSTEYRQTALLKDLHSQQPPHLTMKPTAARTLHSATLYLQWLKAGVGVLATCQDPGSIPERLEKLYADRQWKQDDFLMTLRKWKMKMTPGCPLPPSSPPPQPLHHHHQQQQLQKDHLKHHHHHQTPYMKDHRVLVMKQEDEEEEEVGEWGTRPHVLQSSLSQCRVWSCRSTPTINTNTPSALPTPPQLPNRSRRGWGRRKSVRVGRARVVKLGLLSSPSPPPLRHIPSSSFYLRKGRGRGRGRRGRGRGRGRKIVHKEVEERESGKRRKEEIRDNGGSVVVSDGSMCDSVTCRKEKLRKPPSTTPYSPPQQIRTQDKPLATPNPPQAPQATPTTPSFHTFLQHEIATLRNTTPLHTLLNMDSFWSPHAPLTPYTPIKLEVNPPGTFTPTRTPVSPWGEGVKMAFSPSMFVVQAALMADGARERLSEKGEKEERISI